VADKSIETSVDRLVSYLKKNGETEVSILSGNLGIGEDTMTDLVKILEKASIVKITYKLGKMYVAPATSTDRSADVVEAQKKVEEVKKADVVADVSAQDAVLNRISKQIDDYSKSMKGIEEVFKTKNKQMYDSIKRISEIERKVEKAYKHIDTRRTELEKLQAVIDASLSDISKYSESVNKFSLDSSGANAMIQDIRNEINIFREGLDTFNKTAEKSIDEYRKSSKIQSDKVLLKIEELSELAKLQAEQIKSVQEQSSKYYKDSRLSGQRAAKRAEHFVDEITKYRNEIDAITKSSEADFNFIKKNISDIKDKVGKGAALAGSVGQVQADIETIREEQQALSKEISGILDGIHAISPKMPDSKRDEAMLKFEARARKAKELLSTMNAHYEELTKKVDALGK
jgi:DNA repair exonuclease SbcCD ATPase subunit